jgi:heterodisulfide reductase subunit B
MKLAYYPGCSVHGSSREYEMSARKVLSRFGMELEEIEDWNCCGAVEAAGVDHELSVALPARNLTLPKVTEAGRIIMLCSACQAVHNKARSEMLADPSLKGRMDGLIGRKVNTDVEIRHLIHYLASDMDRNEIRKQVKKPLTHVKVVPYYGCVVNRPSRFINGDDPDNPTSLENILSDIGAQVLSFSHRNRCCGGTAMLTEEDVAITLGGKILAEAREAGAHCIATVCPLCQVALENASLKARDASGSSYDLPIVYFTQLMGLAFGFGPGELGLGRNVVSTRVLVEKVAGVPA